MMGVVWYYAKWDIVCIEICGLMFSYDDGIDISFPVRKIKSWDNFVKLGDL